MKRLNVTQLVDFATSENAKAFVISTNDGKTRIYYGNVENSNDATDKKFNKGCLFDNNKNIYQNLYTAKDFYYRSANYGQNTFNHKFDNNTEINNVVQIKNFLYTFNENTSTSGVNVLTNDVYTTLSENNGEYKIDDTVISTYTFTKDNGFVATKDCATNKQYNQIFETPGTTTIDYDSGYYPANVFKCKNQYNQKYDLTSSGRNYIKMDKCNNQLYLKYKIGNNSPEYVELIVALNRHELLNMHKTNMYDVDIVCEKIFNGNSINDNIKTVLKNEIANCVKEICKKIGPVDTLLLNVNVYDKQIELN